MVRLYMRLGVWRPSPLPVARSPRVHPRQMPVHHAAEVAVAVEAGASIALAIRTCWMVGDGAVAVGVGRLALGALPPTRGAQGLAMMTAMTPGIVP